MRNKVFIPPYLKLNDCIGIVAPSGFIKKTQINEAIKLFKRNKWSIQLGNTLNGKSKNYFSANDKNRLDDLQKMLDNPKIKAIVFARGGYGISRIIDNIDWRIFLKHPKWICGYSDITLFLSHIYSNFNIACLHSPMAKNLKTEETDLFYIQYFIDTLKGKNENLILQGVSCSKKNIKIKGEIIGGNLALLAHSVGSQSEFITKNKILFIEDIDEYLYTIDRMFLQLKRAGKLTYLKALILGGFTNIKDTSRSFGTNVVKNILEHCKEYNFPVIYNFPVGHQQKNLCLQIGATYTLKVKSNEKSILHLSIS